MNTDRTHFVYEAYDADGVLLYIGCTSKPGNRYKAHLTGDGDCRGWFGSFVTHWRVSGPYPKQTALNMERARIAAKQPIWNGQSDANRLGPGYGSRPLVDEYLAQRGLMFQRNPRRNKPDLVPAPRRGRLRAVKSA